MARPGLLGAVLAGGHSRRYGRDKATEVVGGQPQIARAVAALEQVLEDVVVVTSRPLSSAVDVPVVPDRHHDAGPLGGLHSALHEAVARGRSGVLLLACDMPLVTSEILGAVARAAPDAPAVAPRRDGGIEPLCAVYRVGALPTVEALLGGDDRSLHRLFDELGGVPVDLGELGVESAHAFFNVNEPADRDRAEELLEEMR